MQLRDHGDLPRSASVHVTVCSKMRAKLVSEVRENINKLKVHSAGPVAPFTN